MDDLEVVPTDTLNKMLEMQIRIEQLEVALRWTLGSIDENHPAKKVLRIALLGEKKDG